MSFTCAQNDSFIPRPGCPFCTRALACGTYSPAYRCSQQDRGRLRTAYGPKLTDAVHDHVTAAAHAGSSSDEGIRGEDAGSNGQKEGQQEEGGWADAMRRTAEEYSSWMCKHVDLHDRYRRRFSGHHSADWEMRDGPEGEQHQHQQYRNSTAQLEHVLGKRDGKNAEKWDELKLSRNFCAVHNDRWVREANGQGRGRQGVGGKGHLRGGQVAVFAADLRPGPHLAA